jgi:hypothetical protein
VSQRSRSQQLRLWTESGPKRVAASGTGVRAEADIPLRARNSLDRPELTFATSCTEKLENHERRGRLRPSSPRTNVTYGPEPAACGDRHGPPATEISTCWEPRKRGCTRPCPRSARPPDRGTGPPRNDHRGGIVALVAGRDDRLGCLAFRPTAPEPQERRVCDRGRGRAGRIRRPPPLGAGPNPQCIRSRRAPELGLPLPARGRRATLAASSSASCAFSAL